MQSLLEKNNVKYENDVRQLEERAALLAQEKDVLSKKSASPSAPTLSAPLRAEERALIHFMNRILEGDRTVQTLVPIPVKPGAIEDSCRSGVLLCKIINWARPGTIDERAINFPQEYDKHLAAQNHMLCLNSASAIGCKVFHLNVEEMVSEAAGAAFVDLGWEIVRVGCLGRVSLSFHPEMSSLYPGKSVDDVALKSPEKVLLKWIRQLSRATSVANFGKDLSNCATLASLASSLFSTETSPIKEEAIMGQADHLGRANTLLQALATAAPLLFLSFVDPLDIVKGNDSILVVFLAVIFHSRSGLQRPPMELVSPRAGAASTAMSVSPTSAGFMGGVASQQRNANVPDAEGTREERAFCAWINSLRLNTFVTNLHSDMHDGVVLSQVLDKIAPGQVPWSKISQVPKNRFAKIENCNILIGVSKKLGFSLVGIDGSDFVERNRKLILALVWQACKHHLVSILPSVNGRRVDEAYLCSWASDLVSQSNASIGRISSLKDADLSRGVFLLELLNCVEPGIVDSQFIAHGDSTEEKAANAKYIISLARKMGCFVFCVFEDIVDGKSNMMFTILATLLKCFKDKQSKQ